MSIKLGSLTVNTVKLGSSNVDALYLGPTNINVGGGELFRVLFNGNPIKLNGNNVTFGAP